MACPHVIFNSSCDLKVLRSCAALQAAVDHEKLIEEQSRKQVQELSAQIEEGRERIAEIQDVYACARLRLYNMR